MSDTFLDPWRCFHADGFPAQALLTSTLGRLAERERRLRARRSADLFNHQALVDTIVANIAWAVTFEAAPHAVAWPLARPTEKADRYERKGLRKLKETLQAMEAAGLIQLSLSRQRRQASTFRPSEDFSDKVTALELTARSFGRAPGEEMLWLCRTTRDYATGSADRQFIDYRDTAETDRFRSDLEAINGHLAKADLAFLGNDPLVNPAQRKMHRVFSLPLPFPENLPRFDMGGRLFGAWWETLGSSQRHLIRIDGEPISELDYSSMFTRLAYLHVGTAPPAGDLYQAVAGIETADHREGIKKVMNALWFRSEPLGRLPKGTKALLPDSLRSASIVVAAIIEAHPQLSAAIATNIGFRLMKSESDIMVALLLRLLEMGITVLPLHDGVLVAHSKAGIAEAAMGEVSEEIVGCRLPIKQKEQRTPR